MNIEEIVLAILFLAAGFFLGFSVCNDYYEEATITHSCAHYDSKTGEHTWNDEVKK